MKDKCTRMVTYTQDVPVFKPYSEIRHDIAVASPRAIEKAGKIYLYNQYVLINDVNKGVHIFEVASNATTTPLAFIPITGNKEIAVRNGVLFADNYTDLLAIDLSNMNQPTLISRKQDAFPAMWVDETQGAMVGYEQKTVTEEMDCQQAQWAGNGGGGWEPQFEGDMTTTTGGNAAGGGSSNPDGRGSGSGTGGSMARFTVLGSYLYTVDNSNLRVFDIADATNIDALADVSIGWGIETIFPANGHLFIGSTTGMFIYEVSNPAAPTQVSRFDHAESCDPVFVSGNFAYVTLRSGTPCQGTANELNVLDITDLSNPVLLNTYPMHNPHGLSVSNEILYLCEGDEGFKVFDVTNKMAIDQNMLSLNNGFNAFDVIASPSQPIILVIGDGGLRIYNNSNPRALSLVATIPVP
jgi:hypothetical protein